MQTRLALRLLLCLMSVPVLLGLAGGSPAAADGGLAVTSSYTYTVDPASDVVHVAADVTFTNVVPDTTSGNITNRTYFKSFSLPLPVEAVNTVATQNGRPLALTTEPIEGTTAYFRMRIAFPVNIYYRQTAHVLFTYDITGQVPRSAAGPTRINGAYVAFDAYGIADSGKLTVRVVVPSAYTVDKLGSDVTQTSEDGNTVYTATNIDKPNDFNIFVSARNDAALESTALTAGGHDFVLRSWPGDADWKAFAQQQINVGVPALKDLIGQPWPITGSIDVSEAYTPYLYGYAGWFNPKSRKLEIGEDLDAQVMIHELSHAWFNDSLFSERWVNEGMAQEYSGLANQKLGLAAVTPKEIAADDPGVVKLNEWGDPLLGSGANDTEKYGYNASWSVISRIVDEVGVDKMRDIFTAATKHTIAYVGAAPAEPDNTPTDWRRFLDLADQLGGATKADALFNSYVITPPQIDEMRTRATARMHYEALAAAGSGWAPPLAVRRAMSEWSFSSAETLINDSTAALTTRDELTAAVKPLDLAVPAALQQSYESAEFDLKSIQRRLDDQLGAAKQLNAATAAEGDDHGLFGKVGLVGEHLHTDLADARTAFEKGDTALVRSKSAAVIAAVNGSHDVGRNRVLLAGLALLLFLLLIVGLVLLIRRRRRPAVSIP